MTGDPQTLAEQGVASIEDIDRGELGVKTGRGFYTYPDPAYPRPGFVESPESRT
jgi:hypothetical protein